MCERVLESFKLQSIKKSDFEVIVIVDGSDEDYQPLFDKYADEINLKNISVYDVAGKEFQVTTFDLGSNLKSVNIQNLPSGLYVMKLKCSDGSTVNKLFTKDWSWSIIYNVKLKVWFFFCPKI